MTQAVSRFNRIPGMNVFTSKLIDILKDGKVGDTLSDDQLSKACGRNVSPKQPDKRGYSNLQSAISHVINSNGVVWGRVRGSDYIKCLNTDELIEHSKGDLRAIRKKSIRSIKKLDVAIKVNSDPSKVPLIGALAAQHGLMKMFATENKTKVLASNNSMDSTAALKMLSDSM